MAQVLRPPHRRHVKVLLAPASIVDSRCWLPALDGRVIAGQRRWVAEVTGMHAVGSSRWVQLNPRDAPDESLVLAFTDPLPMTAAVEALGCHQPDPTARHPHIVEVPASAEIRSSSHLRRWVRETDGQDLIEYLLVATLIAITVVAGASSLGSNVNEWYGAVADLVEEWSETLGGRKSNCSDTGMAASGGKCG